MNGPRCLGLALALALLSGCSILQGAKLATPENFGLSRVDDRIYLESAADEATRAHLKDALATAEQAIRATYGSPLSHPTVHACVSESCYESFGGRGSTAKVYGNFILLSPRGLNWHYLAHEWSHAELRSRLGWRAWWNMPQWFDEGLAVAVSAAPKHSEEHWQFLVRTSVPRPSRDELMKLSTLRTWLDAVERYGVTGNAARRARGEAEIAPVYAAAGHEVRAWLQAAGDGAVRRLIARLNAGETFLVAYRATAAGDHASP